MIINSDIKSQGVFPPEGCLDLSLEKFKKELGKRNIQIIENHQ